MKSARNAKWTARRRQWKGGAILDPSELRSSRPSSFTSAEVEQRATEGKFRHSPWGRLSFLARPDLMGDGHVVSGRHPQIQKFGG